MTAPVAATPDLVPIVTLRAGDRQKVLYGLQPKQMEAYRLTPINRRPWEPYPRHIGYGGAAGGGKSFLARAVATSACFAWPGCTGIIFRRTRPEVRANHVMKFRLEVPETWEGQAIWSWNGEDMLATFANQSKIYFGYLKDEDDLLRYQGPEYDFMIFEEATHYEWKLVRWLTGNRLRATVDGARPFVLYPSNPGNIGHHWYKRIFITRKYYAKYNETPDQFAFVQAKVADNAVLMDRDPGYLRELSTMPEPYRSWMMNGDWDAGVGLALPMVNPDVHLIPQFEIPSHWPIFGSFDWGFAHPFSFGLYTSNEDGRRFKIDTTTGMGLQPRGIVERMDATLERWGIEKNRVRYVAAGHDCWQEKRAFGENTPSIADQFLDLGYTLVRANISRVAGLNNLRRWLSVDEEGIPPLTFFDTDGNRAALEQLESIPTDPKNPEDAFKTDADEFGHGGDDIYDETRYAMADRQPAARSRFRDVSPGAWSKETLLAEAENQRRSKMPRRMNERPALHPEFGDIL